MFHEIGLADELGSGVRNLFKYTPIYSEFVENDIFKTIIPINYKEDIKSEQKKYNDLNDMQIKILELIIDNNIKQEEI